MMRGMGAGRLGAALALGAVILSAGRAGASEETTGLKSFYERLGPIFEGASAGLYLVHGRDATAVGPGLEWQLCQGCKWLRFNLIAARSNAGDERLIPGLGVRLLGSRSEGSGAPASGSPAPTPGPDRTPDVTLGVCWTPSAYGMVRIGGLKTCAAPYIGLRLQL